MNKTDNKIGVEENGDKNLIPDFLSDYRSILFWVIIIILLVNAIVLYLNYRKMSKKNIAKHLNTIDQMKKSKEERMKEFIELRDKTEKILEEEKKNL